MLSETGLPVSDGNYTFHLITNNHSNYYLCSVHLFCVVSLTIEVCITTGDCPNANIWMFPGSALPCVSFKKKIFANVEDKEY